MKRILVPVDFSATSEKAFRFAYLLCAKNKGSITLFHVPDQVDSPFIEDAAARRQYNLQQAQAVLKRMQRLRQKVCGTARGIPVATVLGKQPVVKSIIRFAEENHCNLIVMGTQGATGIKQVVVGSVAARIAEQTTVPLLLVPARYKLTAPEQVAFAADPERSTTPHFQQLLQLIKPFKTSIAVVRLISKTDDPIALQNQEAGLQQQVKSLKKELGYRALTPQLVPCTNLIYQLEQLHKKVPYNLLTMVRRQKSLLERFTMKSFTKNMAYVTTRPLLILPE